MASRKKTPPSDKIVGELQRQLESARADPSQTALRLVQHEDGGPAFLIYATDQGIKTELRFEGETPWFTYPQLGQIFGVDESVAIRHVQNFLDDGELKDATTAEFAVVRREGQREVARNVKHFGLDVAFYVGYRVNSAQGVMFRRWATDMLIRIAKHGYYIDKDRLKDPERPSVIDQVKSEIYEIRAAMSNAYREVLRIVSLCSDYNGSEQKARDFFARMENKMLFAATGRTAPELLDERASLAKPNMGLTCWSGKNGPIKRDVNVANNYLFPDEAERKNHITVMLLDYFQEQANQGRLVTMTACEEKLDGFIKFNQWEILKNAGSVSRPEADARVWALYDRFKRGDTGDALLEAPKKQARSRRRKGS